jgi:hypothetical protein
MKTIEQLNEKLQGKIWEKGDKKRIYLDRGYNTKKMKTSTYVELVDCSFIVKCFIECDSQGWNWIKSQQEEIIERVENEISNFILKDKLVEELKGKQQFEQVKVCLSYLRLFEEGEGLYDEIHEMYKYYCELSGETPLT